ncbi:MAG: hypothetical protein M1580_01775 [Candidatus Parvarchaeota archaeon]|nr:hypothetical protein [Candidatus Parvarchaeota archaeon]
MTLKLSSVIKKSKEKESAINLNEFKNYEVLLKYPNKIKKGDIVLNAGLTNDIYSGIYNGSFTKRFLSEIYGIYVNKEFNKSSNLYEIYKTARSTAGNKKGLDRALAIADSVYLQLYYRMIEYTDSYSKKNGIITSADLLYFDGANQHKGKAIYLDYLLIDGPFLCHEFAVTLNVVLGKEKRKTGLKPFYVMGMIEKGGEMAEHCWVELRNGKGKRILLDPISNVVQSLDQGQKYVVSNNGVKYWIDNGPFILRKSHLTK